MLKGNVDQITPEQISGWVYSDAGKVTGRRLLAFYGDRCIGSGEIGLLRPDLRDAGLGDGKLGFEIAIDAAEIKDLQTVHLRLEFSDFALFHTGFHQQFGQEAHSEQHLFSPEELARVDWMNRQGWLTNEQYIGLKALNTLGIYQRTFSKAELAQEPMAKRAVQVYSDLVSSIFRTEILESSLESAPASDLIWDGSNNAKYGQILGLFGDAFEIGVYEGAHSEKRSADAEPIQYRNALHQLILVHVDCVAAIKAAAKSNVQVLRVRR